MSNNYQPQAEAVVRMIADKGQEMLLQRVALGAYDPVSPGNTVASVVAQTTAHGIVLPANNATIASFDDRILTDPRRRQSFRFVILAGLGLSLTPRAQDVLITNEGAYQILGATPLNPDGQQVLLWNVGCTLDLQVVVETDTSILEGEIIGGDELV